MKRNGIWIIVVVVVLVIAGIWWWQRDTDIVGSPDSGNGLFVGEDIGSEPLAVISEEPVYSGETKGFYARPEDNENYPGIVMIHEWWGLNDYIKDMARKLAAQGYQVLAVDLYNGEVAADANRARELTSGLDQAAAVENLRAATDWLRGQDATKVAALGWCFGGGQAVQLSLSGEALDATVIYYGSLVTDQEQLIRMSWPVLGIFGEEDTAVPVESARKFKESLDANNVTSEIYIYPGVGHAFANPSNSNHAPAETADAWAKTLNFLDRELKN